MATSERSTVGRDALVIGLIGTAHACSHFYQFVLPPLFVLLKAEFAVSYTELGVLMTVYYAMSGCLQAPAGFAVDRIGATRVLIAGILMAAGAAVLFGLAPSFWALVPLVAVAGIGNSVFHPTDYTILTASVSEKRLGLAYGVHTVGGNLGWAAAWAFMWPLAEAVGWRGAVMVSGGVGLLVAFALVACRHRFHDHRRPAGAAAEAAAAAPAARRMVPRWAAILVTGPVLLCLAYFTLLSTAGTGMQTFLPTILFDLHATPLTDANAALTGFFVAGSAGTIAGAMLARRHFRPDLVVGLGLAVSSALVLVVSGVALGTVALIAAIAGAGFAMGITTPSRDLMVRAAAPAGATGRIFGFVYSGLDIGGAIAPVIIGGLLDHGLAREALWLTVVLLLVAIGAIVAVRRSPVRRLQPAE